MGRATARVIDGSRAHRNCRGWTHHSVVIVEVVALKVAVVQSRGVAAAVAVGARSRHAGYRKALAPVPARRLRT